VSDLGRRFLQSEDGATAIEYGFIAAAFGMAIILGFPVVTTAWRAQAATIASWFP
jgi:Flp pilus assembly pilin Flp